MFPAMTTSPGRPGLVSITFMAPNKQNAALAAIGAQRDRKRSYLIREAIDEYIERHQVKEEPDTEPRD
jgi:predicted transcriptional regulator